MINTTRIAGFVGTTLVAVVSVFQNFMSLPIANPVLADSARGSQSSSLCIECIRIRVGSPIIARGPGPDIEDFSVIQLPDGRFRGFIAGGRTYAIDGKKRSDMGGPRQLVFDIGAPGTYDSCGQWIHHVEQSGSKIIAWVHKRNRVPLRRSWAVAYVNVARRLDRHSGSLAVLFLPVT
jgi:hypothetical protein